MNEATAQLLQRRFPFWVAFVTVFAALGYAGNFAADDDGDRERDLLYQWSTAIAGLIQYAVIAVIVLLIVRGVPRADLGFRAPDSWRRALASIGIGLVGIWVLAGALGQFLDAGDEQGLVPKDWDSSRWLPFLANAVVVAGVAPVVEELAFRGVGFATTTARFGTTVAVVVTGIAFGLAHGLLVALPVLAAFGLILGWVRARTASVYPPMILHGLFNGVALIAAAATG